MIEEREIEELTSRLRGPLITPGEPGYHEARRVWNAMVDKRPALIARCTGVPDVVTAIGFAHDHDLTVAVRGGGHNVAGNAVCDDGLVIDLSAMKRIRVDATARTARAEGGVLWGDLDRETQLFGLATNGGVVSTTGIAGLTLGGGIGWLARKHGLTCDNLRSADVVTADGVVLTASATDNQELFWGLRGGGGNFGIVTSFEYQLYPVGPEVVAGAVFHAAEDATAVLRFFRDFVSTAPDALTVIAAFTLAPEAPFVPVEAQGRPAIALAVAWIGETAEGEAAVRPLREFGRPLADAIQPMPYTALQTMFDAGYPPGLFNYWKSNFVDELTDEAIDTVVGCAATRPPTASLYFEHLEGAIARPREDTAFGHRDATFDFAILSSWADPADTDSAIAWARETWTAMQPFASRGVYVNNLGDEGDDRVRAAYTPETYDRLVALKDRYDPDNFFRLNQNIRPTAGATA